MVFAMVALVGLILGIILHMAVIAPIAGQIAAKHKVVTPPDKIKELEADLDSKSIYAMIREGERKVGSISEKWNEDLPILVSTPIIDENVMVSGKIYTVRRVGDKAYILDNGWIERDPIFRPYINVSPGYLSKFDVGAVAHVYHKETYPEPRTDAFGPIPTKFAKHGEDLEESDNPCHVIVNHIITTEKTCPHYSLINRSAGVFPLDCHRFYKDGKTDITPTCPHIVRSS